MTTTVRTGSASRQARDAVEMVALIASRCRESQKPHRRLLLARKAAGLASLCLAWLASLRIATAVSDYGQNWRQTHVKARESSRA